ncbi:unnamed protein product [Triticum turgidum subsp. durum]|uniref:Uncharacterized protein n=1 Tax=Triticum turgidum subsp. durum TaxID=4567 RepID=A0A9R0TIN7_TRITD|nr:unnamed protein product [Triticum turgidum subsp. durum]
MAPAAASGEITVSHRLALVILVAPWHYVARASGLHVVRKVAATTGVSTSTTTGVASARAVTSPPDPDVVEGMSIQQCAVTSPPDPAVVKGVSIQQRAVIPIITVHGVIAQAQSGAGKTSMISLFVCQVIETNVHE